MTHRPGPRLIPRQARGNPEDGHTQYKTGLRRRGAIQGWAPCELGSIVRRLGIVRRPQPLRNRKVSKTRLYASSKPCISAIFLGRLRLKTVTTQLHRGRR
jgi:hypothetical protein